jgi:hypothetical protein
VPLWNLIVSQIRKIPEGAYLFGVNPGALPFQVMYLGWNAFALNN